MFCWPASPCIYVMKTNLMHCLSSVYSVSQHHTTTNTELAASFVVRWGADKSLARPTSRCRRTESIVSLERGVCSCAELQVFSCYTGWKEAFQLTRTISTTSRRELSSSFFYARQGAEGNSRHSDRNLRGTCTIVCHRQKNWVVHFQRGDFSTCDAPRPERPKTVTTPEIIDQIHELILDGRPISAKSIAQQLGISRERVGSIIH